jgi:D-alanine-D-alanine ligase
VLQAIDLDRYEVIPIGITRSGAFTLASSNLDEFVLRAGELPEVHDNGTRIHWPESTESREIWVSGDGPDRSLGVVDIVFPILHGPYGEDGTIQGMLELLGLPYVGSGVLASSVGMDKHFTKTVLQAAEIAVAPWRMVTRFDWHRHPLAIRAMLEQMALPVFVKPARAGSSVGVVKVHDWVELDSAMATAFAEDDHVLVEAGIVGREVECAVLQGRPGEPTRASVAGEIVVSGRDFYDFEAKYLDAPGIDLVCPAELSNEELAELQRLSIRAFEAIGGASLARVDFFLTESGFVLNEINTMPGFTPISMFPRCWEASGLSYPELVDELIQVALAHHREH